MVQSRRARHTRDGGAECGVGLLVALLRDECIGQREMRPLVRGGPSQRLLKRVSHSMKLEDQGVSKRMEKSELDRRIEKLLRGSRRALWQ